MKKLLFILILSVFAGSTVHAKNRKIENPSYEVKTTGIYNIPQIELSKKETRVTVLCSFIPDWWVKFSEKTFIKKDESDEKIFATGIEGTEFNKETYMPASGDTTLVLIFPPLDKSVKKIHFGDEDKTLIFGINLDKKNIDISTVSSSKIENAVKWVKAEVAKDNRVKTEPNSFFFKDTARIRGYIKGYDPRIGFKTGIIYASNQLTREDYPIVVQIHPDGRFEADFEINYPIRTALIFERYWLPFYVEPGQTVGILFDWEEFLTADRLRNIRYQFRNIKFEGPLATINNELNSFTPKRVDYNNLSRLADTLMPSDFQKQQKDLLNENMDSLDKVREQQSLSPKAVGIIKNDVRLNYVMSLFELESIREYKARKNKDNAIPQFVFPDNYFDFLQEIPMQDKNLLSSSEFSSFVNRFEYCEPFRASYQSVYSIIKPEKSLYKFLQEKKEIKLTNEERSLLQWSDTFKTTAITDKLKEEIEVKGKQFKTIEEKYKTQIEEYIKIYIDPIKQTSGFGKGMLKQWLIKDSILVNKLKLSPNLVYEIIKIRSLAFSFKNMEKEEARNFLTEINKGITHPFLKSEGERMFKIAFPENTATAYALPEGKASEVFRKIIDPFKGKILFIDFWATSCGPCVGGIKSNKRLREKYKNNPDFDFIFITDEKSSPLETYNKFVIEQELQNINRLTSDDFNFLRQLFKFNGIPRYVVINKEGKVLNDDFQMHNFEAELKKILDAEKKTN